METKKDSKELLDDIKGLFDILKDKRSMHEAEWQDVCTYIGSNVFDWSENKEEIKRPKRHTGRPSEYLKKLVSGLMGYTISPNVTWLKLSLNNTEMQELKTGWSYQKKPCMKNSTGTIYIVKFLYL